LFKIQPSGEQNKQIWFYFQKTKYIYDQDERKTFKSIEFPINNTLKYYVETKGFHTDQQVNESTDIFGLNK
jgi:hypothetical protein